MKKGKRYADIINKVDRLKLYEPGEAIELVKETATAGFDESIEIAVRLGVDPRHADQQVRGTVVLPFGTGKTQRVLVFAKGEKAKEDKKENSEEKKEEKKEEEEVVEGEVEENK